MTRRKSERAARRFRCDPQWSWHPDPSDVEFADFTIELCDGVPSYIQENKAEWFATVMRYCPWSASVTDVTNVEWRARVSGRRQP